jgi:hypothetical protein
MGYHHESSLVLSSKCCNWAYHDMFLSKSRISSPEWFTHVSAILRHCKTESTETASFFSGRQRCAQDYTYYNFTPQLLHTQTVWWLQRHVLFHCCMGSWFPTNYLGLVALILRQISVSWNHHTVSYRFGLEKPRLRAGKSRGLTHVFCWICSTFPVVQLPFFGMACPIPEPQMFQPSDGVFSWSSSGASSSSESELIQGSGGTIGEPGQSTLMVCQTPWRLTYRLTI